MCIDKLPDAEYNMLYNNKMMLISADNLGSLELLVVHLKRDAILK